MEGLKPRPRLNRPDDLVRLASTTNAPGTTSFAPNPRPHRPASPVALRYRRRNSDVADQNRPRSTTPTARSPALSGFFGETRPRTFLAPTTQTRSSLDPGRPFGRPRSPSNRIEQDRTPPNAQTQDPQRSAVLPSQDAENLFRAEHQAAILTRPPGHRSPDPERRRTRSNRTEHHRTLERTISSAQRYFRRRTPDILCASNAPNWRRQPTASGPREA